MSPLTVIKYAADVQRWSQALSAGRNCELLGDLALGATEDIARFRLNAVGERFRLLYEELAFAGLAFDDFPALIKRYLHEQPQRAFNLDHSDREQCLAWLKASQPLTAQQLTFIEYQLAEYACLRLARRARAAHVWFQRLRQEAAGRVTPRSARWRVNPIRVWSWLSAPRPDGSDLRERDVVFFAANEQILSLGCSAEERSWLGALESAHDDTLDDWAARVGIARSELTKSAEAWRQAGLITPRCPTK
jgi:hypothetical protein